MPLTRLRPIEHLSQVDKIELRLQEYLRNEEFNPGDPLPKEMEIAKALGVSRTAVREAISRFKMLGIIESRRNRGMVIRRPDVLRNIQRVMDPRLLDGDTMKDIFEMRLVVELGLAHILFRRKTPEFIEKLEHIARTESETTDRIDLLKLDVDFHSALYQMSGNETIIRFQRMLMPIFDFVDSVILQKTVVNQPRERATHWDLIEELKNGTPTGFMHKMESHLWYFFEKI